MRLNSDRKREFEFLGKFGIIWKRLNFYPRETKRTQPIKQGKYNEQKEVAEKCPNNCYRATKSYQLKLQKEVGHLESDVAIAKRDLWEFKKKMLYTVETQSTPEAETMWKPRHLTPSRVMTSESCFWMIILCETSKKSQTVVKLNDTEANGEAFSRQTEEEGDHRFKKR